MNTKPRIKEDFGCTVPAKLLLDSPITYKDSDIEMRLVLDEPNIAVCLEWLHPNGEWIEVSSMRPVAFNAFLEAYVNSTAYGIIEI